MENRSEHVLDELLVLQAQDGDSKSLAILVTKWHKKLVAYSYRQTHDIEASKDLVQEAWQSIIKSIGSLKDPAKFRVWAFRIVHNKAINWIRNQQKQRTMVQEMQVEFDSGLEEKPDFGSIRRAIDRLTNEQKTILNFFYHHNYSIKEISEILNINIGTVKSRLYNARQKVKEYYTT